MAEEGLRRYGPGKFDLDVDSYVYDLAFEGWEEESAGSVDEVGYYYGRLPLGPEALKRIEEIAAERGDKLTDEERALIRGSRGAIFSEDDQGSVSVEYYAAKRAQDKKWKEIEEEVSAYEEAEAMEQGEGG